MKKKYYVIFSLILFVCVVIILSKNKSEANTVGEDFSSIYSPNVINSDDNDFMDTISEITSDKSDTPKSTENAVDTKPEPVLSIDGMSYSADSFALNKTYNFYIALSESARADTDKNFKIEVLAGDITIGSGKASIKQGETVANTAIPVKFDKPCSFCTKVKIYDGSTNELILEKDAEVTREASSHITGTTELFGLDHFDAKSASTYKKFNKNGVGFIARYYSENKGKCITKKEAQNITDAGMQIVTVYQDKANALTDFNNKNGQADCKSAIEHAKNIGQPYDTPIYFAVDVDAKGSTLKYIQDYFQGINDAMNEYKTQNGQCWQVGVYGSYYVVYDIHSSGLATYSWQTASWSEGKLYDKNNIYQYIINTTFLDISVDKNNSNKATNHDVGGFYIE